MSGDFITLFRHILQNTHPNHITQNSAMKFYAVCLLNLLSPTDICVLALCKENTTQEEIIEFVKTQPKLMELNVLRDRPQPFYPYLVKILEIPYSDLPTV